ncbi:hypothetical protein D3C85_1422850 [compost metagenome]
MLLSCPQAHGKHGKQVVEAAERVANAGQQAMLAVAGMGEGDGRAEQQGEGGECFIECHGNFL